MASEAGAGGEAVASALGKSPSSDNQLEAASYKQHHHHHHHHRTTAPPPSPAAPSALSAYLLDISHNTSDNRAIYVIACHGTLAPT